VISEEQRERLGGRFLEAALADTRRFEEDSRVLFSAAVAQAHPAQWVGVHLGRIVTAADLDQLMCALETQGIDPASVAVGFIEAR